METEIKDTIRDIDQREWSMLVGTDHIERSHAWYRTIEDSRMRTMHYVLLKENDTLVAAACCFCYKERMYVELPLLEVRSPLGTSSAFFSKTPEHTRLLLCELEEIRKREKAKGLSLLELTEKEYASIGNQMRGFIHFPIFEETYIDLAFGGFGEYLEFLKYSARRSVKKTLAKTKKWKIRTHFTTELSQWKKVAHRLRGLTCEEHNSDKMYLTEQFYEACERNLKEKAELLLCFKDDVPIASGLSFHSSTVTLCKFVGIDPQYREYQAYFLMYYELIKKALERNQKRIYFGPSTYEFKQKIGCKKENRYGFVKLKNPLLHYVLKSFLTTSKLSGKKF